MKAVRTPRHRLPATLARQRDREEESGTSAVLEIVRYFNDAEGLRPRVRLTSWLDAEGSPGDSRYEHSPPYQCNRRSWEASHQPATAPAHQGRAAGRRAPAPRLRRRLLQPVPLARP